MYNMAVQASGIIGANLYQAQDAPRYTKANTAILAIIVFNVVIMYPGVYLYYKARNAHKAKQWNKMTVEQQTECMFTHCRTQYKTDFACTDLETTKDEGARRLDFRFAY